MSSRAVGTRALAVVGLLAGVLLAPPLIGSAAASITAPSWTQPLRYPGTPVVAPDGTVIANTGTGTGGVPTGGAILQAVSSSGLPTWSVPYTDQEVVSNLAVDNAGTHYWVDGLPPYANYTLRASVGSVDRWAVPASPTDLAVGTNGQIYTIEGGKLVARAASNGAVLATSSALPAGSSKLFAYAGGLIVAGATQIAYYNYANQLIGGPYQLPPFNSFRPIAASATGDLYVVSTTSTINGCTPVGSPIVFEKFTSAGLSWTTNFSGHQVCPANGGGWLNSTPSGAVLSYVDSGSSGLQSYQFISANGLLGAYAEFSGIAGTGDQILDAPQVDSTGSIYQPERFIFECNLYSDYCTGMAVIRVTPGGTVDTPVLEKGPTDVNQESWTLYSNTEGIMPGQVVLSGYHGLGGAYYGALTPGMYGFSVPGLGAEYPAANLIQQMPIKVTGPIPTVAAVLSDPNPMDKLLRRGLALSASPGSSGSPIAYFRYGWSPAGSTARQPTTGLQKCTILTGKCTVSFAATSPNSPWKLWVRAVDQSGAFSPWTLATTSTGATTVQTPSTPILVALGDSITSGHHRDSGVAPTICNDPKYGYPNYVWQTLESALPSQWRGSGYYNFARSGFSTVRVIGGGVDACGMAYGGFSPLSDAEAILTAHRGTWSRVLITAGIDDTNWVDVVGTVAANSGIGWNPSYGKALCSSDMANWTGYDLSVQQGIKTDIHTIMNGLFAADSAVGVTWRGYYNIAGTGTLAGALSTASPVPAACDVPVQAAVASINATIKQGLLGYSGYRFVNSDQVMHGASSLIQPFYSLWDAATVGLAIQSYAPGWPHPNANGAATIAGQVAP